MEGIADERNTAISSSGREAPSRKMNAEGVKLVYIVRAGECVAPRPAACSGGGVSPSAMLGVAQAFNFRG